MTDMPDKYCVTQKDGSCLSNDPRCMHQARKPMTPHYRAQKFLMDQGLWSEEAESKLTAEISLAQEEAIKKHHFIEKCCDACFLTGFEKAIEKAAKVAESYLMIGSTMNPQFPQIAKNTADQIRALKIETNKMED